eukprot:XP_013983226.1 PREDICTED: UPF0606 protein KIAA1549L-like [Salmo salar]
MFSMFYDLNGCSLCVPVLRFVGPGDDPRSCRFSQMMEQRLENVFSEAQAKVLDVHTRLSVQMLSVSQSVGSPAVSLVYMVRNGTAPLNGTAASNLLGQLTAEMVGYFLFYPPLVIAEPLDAKVQLTPCLLLILLCTLWMLRYS